MLWIEILSILLLLVFKGLRLAFKGVPLIVLLCKVYLGGIGWRLGFSSSFFLQCRLRTELIWFCSLLKNETMPKPNSRNASWCFFAKMGLRVLLYTLSSMQLSILPHAELLLSIINFSKRNLFASVIQEVESLVRADVRKGRTLWSLTRWRSEVIIARNSDPFSGVTYVATFNALIGSRDFS